MPVIPSKEIVKEAFASGYAIPALNTQGGNYEIVRACMESAYDMRSPLILQVYPDNTSYYGLEWLPVTVNALIKRYDIPIAIHLDHGKQEDIVYKAIDAGFTSVMLDYSQHAIEKNISALQRLLPLAQKKDVTVEAEIGAVGRTDSVSSADKASTEEVKRFITEVSVDMLAVAIGNAHGHYVGVPNIDLELLSSIRTVTKNTPLVLHGTTGIPNDVVKSCIYRGMAKVNIGTHVRDACFSHYQKVLQEEGDTHLWKRMDKVHTLLKEDINELITLCGSNNRL